VLIVGEDNCVRECEENVSRMRIEERVIHIRSLGDCILLNDYFLREQRGVLFG
jgi:hypothetical protein